MTIVKGMENVVKKWDVEMMGLCHEYLTINTRLSELESEQGYYDCVGGITIGWLIRELSYQYDTYFESGHVNGDMQYSDDAEERRMWREEVKSIEKLDKYLKKFDRDKVVVEF